MNGIALAGASARILYNAQVADARLVLRFAMRKLTHKERIVIGAFLSDKLDREVSGECGFESHGGVYMTRQAALRKLRCELARLGIHKVDDLIDGSLLAREELGRDE